MFALISLNLLVVKSMFSDWFLSSSFILSSMSFLHLVNCSFANSLFFWIFYSIRSMFLLVVCWKLLKPSSSLVWPANSSVLALIFLLFLLNSSSLTLFWCLISSCNFKCYSMCSVLFYYIFASNLCDSSVNDSHFSHNLYTYSSRSHTLCWQRDWFNKLKNMSLIDFMLKVRYWLNFGSLQLIRLLSFSKLG